MAQAILWTESAASLRGTGFQPVKTRMQNFLSRIILHLPTRGQQILRNQSKYEHSISEKIVESKKDR